MTGDGLVTLLGELVEIESPTGHIPGVRAIGDTMARELQALGGSVRRVGEHVRAEFAGEGAPLLLIGHLDTVWPVGTLDSMPFRVEDGRAYGPGAWDMKGGLVVLTAATGQARARRRPLRVFLTADEEAGSPTAREHLEEAARGAAAAFVLEPPSSTGALKTSRKGLGRFRLVVKGKAAHAGIPEEGASAVEELARVIVRLEKLEDRERGITVNVGVIKGGVRGNVVADRAEAAVDIRVARPEDVERVETALRTIRPELDGTEIELEGSFYRLPLAPFPGAERLFAQAREHGHALGLDLRETASGGASDANLVGALGVPVLDGLGPEGAGAHARHEQVVIDSIPVRAELVARLLEDPGV